MKTQYLATLLIAGLLLSGCSLFGDRDGYEQPDYKVATRIGEDIEIRRYQPRLAAQAVVAVDDDDKDAARNAAFRLLFDYISGDNAPGAEIAMTTPVETQQQAKGEEIAMTVPVETASPTAGMVRMRFFLPETFTAQTAPAPTHPDVELVALPAATWASIRFSGWTNSAKIADQTATLMQALTTTDWRPTGDPVTYFYDPPWTPPWWRRNEIAVPVEPANSAK